MVAQDDENIQFGMQISPIERIPDAMQTQSDIVITDTIVGTPHFMMGVFQGWYEQVESYMFSLYITPEQNVTYPVIQVLYSTSDPLALATSPDATLSYARLMDNDSTSIDALAGYGILTYITTDSIQGKLYNAYDFQVELVFDSTLYQLSYTGWVPFYTSSGRYYFLYHDAGMTDLPIVEDSPLIMQDRSYNLLGQPVDDTYHGIVIRNGQKVLQ